MKTNSYITRLSALILAGSIAVLTASAADTTSTTDKPAAKHPRTVTTANASRKSAAPTNTEPDRIYDLRSRNFISNPDYHEPPRPTKQTGQHEPRRIFNAITRNVEINPGYREPAGAMEGTRRANRDAEPDRIFDAETGNFEPNPAFHSRW